MDKTKLPGWAEKVLASCPGAGDGVHRWIYLAALKLGQLFKDKTDELVQLLVEATSGCGREVPLREIEEAVSHSQEYLKNPGVHKRRTPRWAERNDQLIRQIAGEGPTLAELSARSPVKCVADARFTEHVIDTLFPGNPLLCVAREKESAFTCSREKLRGYMTFSQFIVPSPMTARFGKTKGGDVSQRSLSNTGPRRFLVVEFDTGTFDEHAAILVHLAKFAPLVLVVHSANRSIHAWFLCAHAPESAIEKFFRYAVSLGADRATWVPCQFVRTPGGMRDNGKRQLIKFFNPKPLEAK